MNYENWHGVAVSTRRDPIEYFKDLYFSQILYPKGHEEMFAILMTSEKAYPMRISYDMNQVKKLSFFIGDRVSPYGTVRSRVYLSNEECLDKLNKFFDLFLLSDL